MEHKVFEKYTGSDECYVLPGDVTEIAEGAFAKNKILKHIDLRNVRRVGAFAFQECTGLETVIMSNAAVREKGAFESWKTIGLRVTAKKSAPAPPTWTRGRRYPLVP